VRESSYGVRVAIFETLAAQRKTESGARLVEADRAFKAAVAAHYEEWEDEYEAGASTVRPSHLRGIVDLFLAAHRAVDHAVRVRDHRDLCFVLATEPVRAA
jgi:hypothetical protein